MARQGGAVPDGQRVPLRAGGLARSRGCSGACRPRSATSRRCCSEVAELEERIVSSRLRQHHRGAGGLRAGRRHERSGCERDPGAPRYARDPIARPGSQGHLPGGRSARFRQQADGPRRCSAIGTTRWPTRCASTWRATTSSRTSSRCSGFEELSEEDRRMVQRARRLQRYLTQPFHAMTAQHAASRAFPCRWRRPLADCEALPARRLRRRAGRALLHARRHGGRAMNGFTLHLLRRRPLRAHRRGGELRRRGRERQLRPVARGTTAS